MWDDFLDIVYSWGIRYPLEIGLALVFFCLLHFVGYPIVLRRHERIAQLPPSNRNPEPKTATEPIQTPPPSKNISDPHKPVVSKNFSMPRKPAPDVVSAPSGVAIGGDNFGTASVTNYGPRPMLISDAQLAAVRAAAHPFTGERAAVVSEMGSAATDVFTGRLIDALRGAGLEVEPVRAMNMLTAFGTRPQPGIAFTFPEGKADFVIAIASALKKSGFPVPAGGFAARALPKKRFNGEDEPYTILVGQSQWEP